MLYYTTYIIINTKVFKKNKKQKKTLNTIILKRKILLSEWYLNFFYIKYHLGPKSLRQTNFPRRAISNHAWQAIYILRFCEDITERNDCNNDF